MFSFCNDEIINNSIINAYTFYPIWKNTSIDEKILIIEKFAKLLEENSHNLIKLCVLEAGKNINDSINDIREAVDFCYYYSSESKRLFKNEIIFVSPGEAAILIYEGKGVFLTISPWNFPIAIFVGQTTLEQLEFPIIAKPAEQTSIIAYETCKLLFKAGLPKNALQLLLGKGEEIGPKILLNNKIKDLLFTGSCETSKIIQNQLKQGNIKLFIEESKTL